jgi:phage terminase large subunit
MTANSGRCSVRPKKGLPSSVGDLPTENLRAILRLAAAGRGTPPMVEYRDDPVGFASDVLKVPRSSLVWSECPGYEGHEWDGDKDPLLRLGEALVEGKDAVAESATGTGKTFWAACLLLWWLGTREDSLVITNAPREAQLKRNLWKEVRSLWSRFLPNFPNARMQDLQVRMRGGEQETVDVESWSAIGMGCGVGAGEVVANRMRGFHAASMLFILEEMTGIPDPVLEAIEQTCVGGENLRLGLGNPDSQQDPLHRFGREPGTVALRISAYDHPNVVTDDPNLIPGAVTRKSIERRKLRLGEDHRLFRSRVRGISPSQAVDALIRRDLCEAAVARYLIPQLRVGEVALGVDVSNSESGDPAVVARGMGSCLLELISQPCPDALAFGRGVGAMIRVDNILPNHVGVDAVGVGSNVVNGLAEEGYRVRALHGSAKQVTTIDWELVSETEKRIVEEGQFLNLRAQMWWYMRRDLERGLIALPDDPELIDDLVEPKWWTKGGKIVLEPKEEIKERLGRSPDKGDAAVYWNWVRPRRPDEGLESPADHRGDEEEPRPQNYDPGLDRILERMQSRVGSGRGF